MSYFFKSIKKIVTDNSNFTPKYMDFASMNFGIIGAGHIAHTFAVTLSQMSEPTAYAIASRDAVKAGAFKDLEAVVVVIQLQLL